MPLCRVRRHAGPDLEIAFKGGQVGGDDLLERARRGASAVPDPVPDAVPDAAPDAAPDAVDA